MSPCGQTGAPYVAGIPVYLRRNQYNMTLKTVSLIFIDFITHVYRSMGKNQNPYLFFGYSFCIYFFASQASLFDLRQIHLSDLRTGYT
jgi:hypothetical protein